MPDHQASRTLVKSAPELWAECSDAASLARHLGRFGEIRITRLEPETAVAWEGEHVSGTVRLEPSGWGTRVTLTARGSGQAAPVAPAIEDPAGDGPERGAEATLEVGAEAEPQEALEVRAEEEPLGAVAQDAVPALAVEGSTDASPPPTVRPGFLARLFGRLRPAPAPAPAAPPPGPKPDVETAETTDAQVGAPVDDALSDQGSPDDQGPDDQGPVDQGPVDPPAVLASALESLGQAHHRPYSRG
jgi:hypothetical protein